MNKLVHIIKKDLNILISNQSLNLATKIDHIKFLAIYFYKI